MTPDVITKIETNPVEVIDDLLRATDGDVAEAFLAEAQQLVNNKPVARETARRVALTLHTRATDSNIAFTKSALAERVGVSASAISQTVTRIEERLETLSSEFESHPLIAYIRDTVGLIAYVSELPTWIQRVITVEPSALEDAWGTPADIAQVVARIALPQHQLAIGDPKATEPPELWLTPNGEPLADVLDRLTEQVTVGGSVRLSIDELRDQLSVLGVPAQRQQPVVAVLTRNKNIIWLPTLESYVAFERPETSQRKSRGNAPKRVADIIKLVDNPNLSTLVTDIVEQFVAQHGLLRATAENAVRDQAR